MHEDNRLSMTFDPNTIQHLGIKMYSNLPSAIAELVANAYDACSPEVKIKMYDDGTSRHVVVQDWGIGMSFDELNGKFLIIGRNRRDEGLKETTCNRIASGKKGLGKLALFGIGGQIDIETTKKGEDTATKLSLVWEQLKNWDTKTQGPNYEPDFEIIESDTDSQGTTITISHLKRKSEINDAYVSDIAVSLSKLFNFLDDNFRVTISFNDSKEIPITNELRYENTERQFEWSFPEYSEDIDFEYDKKGLVSGQIFTSPRPLPSKKQTGVTLFAHGRRVNLPEFFGHLESSNFFSYATGWLNVDFVDDCSEELISTDRKSLDWEHEETILLRRYLKAVISKIHSDWRAGRKRTDKNNVGAGTGIDKERWLATLPPDKAKTINEALEEVSDPDSTQNPVDVLFKTSHNLAPEYAEKHWRYLHERIKENKIIESEYRNGEYLLATKEAVQIYNETVQEVAKRTEDGYKLMEIAFGKENNKLVWVTEKTHPNDENIEEGQKLISQGVMVGFKNPAVSHTSRTKALVRKDFSDRNCLDILSTISYLFDRLENRKKPQQ